MSKNSDAQAKNSKTKQRFIDVPIDKLVPLRKKTINKQTFGRILASIKACGLIEPLLVFPEGDSYTIIDGHQRYQALLELGIKTVPCIIWDQREAFSANRMVNRLSPVQENRMIEQALHELDEKTIAETLGLSRIWHRRNTTLLKQLHPDIASALDQTLITKACAHEFTFVTQDRQKEILEKMKQFNDFQVVFVRNMVLKTPPKQRIPKRLGIKSPWAYAERKRGELMKRLQDTEQKHNFYSTLYKQYSIDLLKLIIYARSLISNDQVRDYLQLNHPNILGHFQTTINRAEG
jgi:ParB family transcriptional regulator, chromosome partitioning protein